MQDHPYPSLSLTSQALSENLLASPRAAHAPSLFTVGDGFLGVRGFLEGEASSQPQVYLNGVYDIQPIRYHEAAHGFADASDTRLPAPDGFVLDVAVGGKSLADWRALGAVARDTRRLDLTTGLLERRVEIAGGDGSFTVELTFRRSGLVSATGVAVTSVAARCTQGDTDIELRSQLIDPRRFFSPAPDVAGEDALYDPRVGPAFDICPWLLDGQDSSDSALNLRLKTLKSGIALDTLVEHQADGFTLGDISSGDLLATQAQAALKQGQTAQLTKWIAYGADLAGCVASAKRLLTDARAKGLDQLLADDEALIGAHMQRSGVLLDDHDDLTGALALGQFQLFHNVGRGGGLSIGAKGQSGEGYEGHVFWDAETYCLPALAVTSPALARDMLQFRYGQLAAAEKIARTMGHTRGVLFPWRSISGRECSAYFPAGTAQYHINSDIALAVRRYHYATGDMDFLLQMGLEIVAQTARIWLDIGHHDPLRDGAFVIPKVTGPDEYTALVDNNLYTNASAKVHLAYVIELISTLREEAPAAVDALLERIGLFDTELAAMQQAADAMFIPEDPDGRLYAQDDSFLHRAIWPLGDTPREKFPLLLHYHPLTIYRYQVCKQADTVAAFGQFPTLFERGKMQNSFRYYEAVTTHDSTLSPSVFASVAARLGYCGDALAYLRDSCLIDVNNSAGNTDHGLHMAALAGSWNAVAEGLAGLQLSAAGPGFDPVYDPAFGNYGLGLCLRGTTLQVTVTADGVQYRHVEGPTLALLHRGEPLTLAPGSTESREHKT